MDFESRVRSLTTFLDDKVIDYVLFDACAVGITFLGTSHNLRLSPNLAEANNVPQHQLHAGLRNAQASLEIIANYESQIGVVSPIYNELICKLELLRAYVRCYAMHAGRKKDRHHSKSRYTHHQKKGLGVLQKILETEERIMGILAERTVAPEQDSVEAIEDLVIAAYQSLGRPQKTKNKNDEKLVAAAVYLAVNTGKYVGIVTQDTRIAPILQKTQKALELDRKRNHEIREALEAGRVTILQEGQEYRGFRIEYCSSDFEERGRKAPEKLREKVATLLV